MKLFIFSLALAVNLFFVSDSSGQYLIYEDKMQLEMFHSQLQTAAKEELITIIKEKESDPYQKAAAVRVLGEKYLPHVAGEEKKQLEEMLRIAFRRGGSSFVRIEIAATLCNSNRSQYFFDMVPFLIRRLNNENNVVARLADERLKAILNNGRTTEKEATIVLDTAKGLIMREDVESGKVADFNQGLGLIRWSLDVLGESAYKRLPYEIKDLLDKGGGK